MKLKLIIYSATILCISATAVAGPTCLTKTVLVKQAMGNICPPGSHAVSNGMGIPY